MKNYSVLFEDGLSRIPVKCWHKDLPLEEEAKKQLLNLSSLSFIKNICSMPDAHSGKGSCVGTVFSSSNVLIPATVGVDLGCGMIALMTSLKASDLPDNLFNLRCMIESAVPHGRTNDGGVGDRGAWNNIPKEIENYLSFHLLKDELENNIKLNHPKIYTSRWINHLGTLGTGNHFIEICLDIEQNVWIMLHSGSRGIGNKIGSYFISKAKEEMEKWHIHLPDKDLSYLPEGSKYFSDYVFAVNWAQRYAKLNRDIMMSATINALNKFLNRDIAITEKAINCHHNYISNERHYGENVWVTRKGAVSAKKGELGIIPGSMGDRSFIVEGKGNIESLMSCSHGAGRVMSRTQARNLFTEEDHIKGTHGVECRKDLSVIDETPKAYKPIEKVMAAQIDSVEIKYTLKQILCVKG